MSRLDFDQVLFALYPLQDRAIARFTLQERKAILDPQAIVVAEEDRADYRAAGRFTRQQHVPHTHLLEFIASSAPGRAGFQNTFRFGLSYSYHHL